MQWISALELQKWADTIQARTEFSGLVSDLIRATSDEIASIRFPSGDKGQVRGFDGFLESNVGTTYIPTGKSIWEFGVSKGAAAKAEEDYNKRTDQLDAAELKETTFVFVTPRTWDNKTLKISDWVKSKKKQKKWKDVVYIDGSMLEDWLKLCPAVASRYAKFVLNLLPPTGVQSTDEFWEEYSCRFSPPLVEAVLTAGRLQQAEELIQRLTSKFDRIAYAADSPDEVIAFAIAAIRKSDPVTRLYLESKTVVIDTEDAAKQLSSVGDLIFLPRSKARNVSGLLSQKGPTVISAGADEKKSGHILLNRPGSTELGKALTQMGFDDHEAYDIARKCGRSLAVLARQRPSGTAISPEWTNRSKELIPALLAGAWTCNLNTDTSIVCTLGKGQSYDEIESPYRELSRLQDPPIERVGDIWSMRAPVDAFVYLGHLLGPEHLTVFSDALKSVFSNKQASPKADDIFVPPSARPEKHSEWLRDGLMTTLLHMAVLHEQADFTVPGSTPQAYVDALVKSLPGLSSDVRLLAGLADQMALLAEAAPYPFLEALELLLEGDEEPLKSTFKDHAGSVGSSPHIEFLWALETIAWDPALLLRASVCLAKLAELDPGGSYSNRPINSLRSIFLSWHPSTAARTSVRIWVLKNLLSRVPSIAWQLLEKLLPSGYDSAVHSQSPKFREYSPENKETLTYGLIWESETAIIKLALHHLDDKTERWLKIIDNIGNFPTEAFHITTKYIHSHLPNLPLESRNLIWDHLRKEVVRHETYASADWAIPSTMLAELKEVMSSFKPDDIIAFYSWLFDDWLPDLPEDQELFAEATDAPSTTVLENLSDGDERIESARELALTRIYKSHGADGLIRISKSAKLPNLIVPTLQKIGLSSDEYLNIFELSILEKLPDHLSGLLLTHGARIFGEKWLGLAKTTMVSLCDANTAAALLMHLPESVKSWSFIKSFGNEVNSTYWKNKQPYYVESASDDLLPAIKNYTKFNRPLAAISAANNNLSLLPTELILRLLESAESEIKEKDKSSSSLEIHSIERLFNELDKRDGVKTAELASLELRFLPLLDSISSRRKPIALQKQMLTEPDFYFDLIKSCFKPKDDDSSSTLSLEQKRNALVSYRLLQNLNTLPGQSENDIDRNTLLTWCARVRSLAKQHNREVITDQQIGHLLAHSPPSKVDDAWPHESVRWVIETFKSDDIEVGIVVERFNMRGVYSKALGEGGQQERTLADQASSWSEAIIDSPRTSELLLKISKLWLRDADKADIRAQQDALRW